MKEFETVFTLEADRQTEGNAYNDPLIGRGHN